MKEQIEVDLNEVKRVFKLLEKMNDLFHQPMKYKNMDVVESFADSNYNEIKELYYDVIWEWFPERVKDKIENN